MEPERLETLSVLFTDLVDSTSLRTRLGEHDAEDLRTRVETVQARAIASQRGRIVKGLGDGLMAVFPAADHALRAATTLLLRLRALARRLDRGLGTRVGVSAGDVRAVDDDVFGTPAIEAARLCAVAAADEILVSDIVRVLAGSWSQHPFDDRGRLTLKGLAAPLRVWALDWERSVIPATPDVGLLVDDEFAFVGRGAELEVLEQAWATARGGDRAAVLLRGEPGVGKTRLAVEMARRAADDGGLVLAGRCEHDATVPHELAQHLLADLVAQGDRATIAVDAGLFAPELARHVASLRFVAADPGPRDPDQDAERFRLYSGVAHLLRAAARRAPLLLLVDDLQWADATSLALVDHLLRTADLGRVCLVATLRDDPHDGREVAARFQRLPGATDVALEGLPAGVIADLVAGSASRLDPGRVWERTRGHPFFAVELIRRARAGEDDGVPASVRDLVLERAAHLDDDARTLLTVGALLGAAFDLGVAGRAADLDASRAADAADQAVAARLVLDAPGGPDRLQFGHALVADTFAALPSRRRAARIHARIAQILDDDGAAATVIAAHTLQAVPAIPATRALAVARAAAHGALAAGEPEQAAGLLERATALDLAGEPALRAELEVELGECWNRAVRPDAGVPHFEAAARLAEAADRHDILARAALGCWAGNPWFANADDTARRLLRLAIDRCPPGDGDRLAALRAGLAAHSIFTASLAERERITAEAVDRARRSDDRALLGTVLAARHVAITCPLAIDRLRDVHRELASSPAELPAASVPGDLIGVSAPDYWEADGDAYRRAAAAFDLSDPRLAVGAATVGTQLQACVALLDGRTADARRHAERAFAIGSWGDASRGNHGWQLLIADWLDGRIGDSLPRARAAYERYGGQPTRLTLAWVEAAAGSPRTARALLDRAGAERLRRLPELFLGSIALAAAGSAAAVLGDRRWVDACITAFAPIGHLMSGVPWVPLPAGAFYLGRLHTVAGDLDRAEQCFAQALELHERMRAPAYVALTQAEWGRAVLPRDRPRAAEMLREAEQFGRDMALPGVIERACDT